VIYKKIEGSGGLEVHVLARSLVSGDTPAFAGLRAWLSGSN
jgi:hypothetical protein